MADQPGTVIESLQLDHRHTLGSAIASLTLQFEERLTKNLSPIQIEIEVPDLLRMLSGGKRLRSQVLLLAAHAYGNPNSEFVTRSSIALEMLHTASLLHDDIIDDSATRRSIPTLHTATDDATAILVGDLLTSLAFHEASDLNHIGVSTLSYAFAQLCVGQLSERSLSWGPDGRLAMETYATRKTGALFGAAFALGGQASAADPRLHKRLRRTGELLGLAFQLADDLQDVSEDVENIGKDLGADLRNEIPTLPIWHAYQRIVSDTGNPPMTSSDWNSRLAEESRSELSRRVTVTRIEELVTELRTTMPEPLRPELIDAMIRIVLSGIPEMTHYTNPDGAR